MSTAQTDRLSSPTFAAIKNPVRVATTAAITLNGLQTVDGVSLASGDRVLVKDQATESENGIYEASTSDWQRANDFDGNNDVLSGTLIIVGPDGTQNGQTIWQVTTDDPISVGTSDIVFAVANFASLFSGTSATSNTIGTGSKTFATQTGRLFNPPSAVLIYSSADPTNYMSGQVTSYSNGSLTVNVTVDGGSGTHTDWVIVSAGQVGATGATPTGGALLAGPNAFTGANNEAEATLASAATLNIGAASGNYIIVTGTTTITAFDTIQAGTCRTLKFSGALTLTNNSSIILSGGQNFKTIAGDVFTFRSEGSGVWREIARNRTKHPTRQVLTSGTSYTTPAGATRLKIRMIGGGGGGGGSGTAGGVSAGSAGGDTSFNAVVAKGGSGGGLSNAGSSPGAGGAGGTSGTGSATLRLPGAAGGAGGVSNTNYPVPQSGAGAASPFGGGGVTGAAPGSTGSGGAGAAGASTSSVAAGGGGGAGEYVEFEIEGPLSSTYTYAIGAGGTAGGAGTSGAAGFAGAAGLILVEEFY